MKDAMMRLVVLLVMGLAWSGCALPFTFVSKCEVDEDCDPGKVCGVDGACATERVVCEAPGRQSGCLCAGGFMGLQNCNADRTGFSPCECGGGSSSSSGASTTSSSRSSSSAAASSAASSSGASSAGSGSTGASSSVGASSGGVSSSATVLSSSGGNVSSSASMSGSGSSSSSGGNGMVTLVIIKVGAKADQVTSLLNQDTGDVLTSCDATTCTVTGPENSFVLLEALVPAKTGALVSGWSQSFLDCGGFGGPLCRVQLTATNSVFINVASVNYIFIKDDNTAPAIPFAAANADAACVLAAQTAGLEVQNYVALLSFTTPLRNARDPLMGLTNLARPDGLPVVEQGAGLASSGPSFLYPPVLNASGQQPGFLNVATGSMPSGELESTQNCNNWMGGMGYTMGTGAVDYRNGPFWAETGYNDNCMTGTVPAFLCVGTLPRDGNFVAEAPPGAKRVFVSDGLFDPASGRAAADILCQTEADAAGLTGRTFLALLGTSTEAADSRFPTSFLRTLYNGVIPFNPTTFAAAEMKSAISLNANGNQPNGVSAATGGDPTLIPPASQTCNDWADPNGTVRVGRLDSLRHNMGLSGSDLACNMSYHVYCMEP